MKCPKCGNEHLKPLTCKECVNPHCVFAGARPYQIQCILWHGKRIRISAEEANKYPQLVDCPCPDHEEKMKR